MPYSGWPITKADLVPYYERAQKVCNLGPFKYDFAYWEEAFKQIKIQGLPFLGNEIITYLWQIVPLTHVRFGTAYKTEIKQAQNINTYLHANVVEIDTNDTAGAVKRVRVASLEGKKFWVSAKVFILAVGGIENARLLLVSNKVQSNGLGNQHDIVGRFFMEHPNTLSGKLLFSSPAALYTQRNIKLGKVFIATALGLSKAVQEREQILNLNFRPTPIVEEWVEAFNRLRYKTRQTKAPTAFPSVIKRFYKYKSQTSAIKDLSKVIANLDRISARAYAKLFNKSFHSSHFNHCNLIVISEQAPNFDSRITLSSERDRLGLNRVQLDWRLSPIDKYTIQRSQQILTEEFHRSGLGQLQTEITDDDTFWQSVEGSYHHIGTTRMSINPREGVVNEHCQVHGISNLYIAGSSVFPTSGHANPTLTIVALAIRLADYIKGNYSAQGLDNVSFASNLTTSAK